MTKPTQYLQGFDGERIAVPLHHKTPSLMKKKKPVERKPSFYNKDYKVTLRESTLEKLGFVFSGLDKMGSNIWRLRVPYYHYRIQMTLGDYPAHNGNCGILSIHSPEETAATFDKRGKEKEIKIPEQTINIAWGVSTPERLMAIITSLSHRNISV
jgi:hypothetical protein